MEFSYSHQLSKQISEDLKFFKISPIFSFEKEKIFSINSSTIKREELIHNGNSTKYQDRKPHFCASNPSISNLFRGTFPVEFSTIRIFDIPTEANRSFFIGIKIGKSTGWFIHSLNYNIIFNESNNTETPLASEVIIDSANGKYLKISDHPTNYPLLFADDDKQTKKLVLKFIEDINKNKRAASYEILALSTLLFKSFPTINLSTLIYYRSVVENPQFLYLLSQLSNSVKYTAEDFHSWIEAAGHYIKTIFPMIVYHYFEKSKKISNVFIEDCFVSKIILCVLNDDEKLATNLDNFSNSFSSFATILSKMSTFKLTPLSQFFISTLLQEATRFFSDVDAQYICFGRLLNLLIVNLNDKKSNKIHTEYFERFTNLCNFSDQVPKDIISNFRRIIKQITDFKDPLYIKPSALTSLPSVSSLIYKAFANPNEFYQLVRSLDFANLLEQYREQVH